MRVFIAIDINDQVRASIRALQSELKKAADIRRKEVPDVCKILESAADRHMGFELSVESVGHFGGRSARVLWVGISEGKQALCQLQEELEGEMEKGGWSKEERPFTGHLTVCRIKNIKAGQRIAEISADYKDFKAGSVLVDSVKVYQSQLMPKGPIYSVLGSFLLQ
jgi:2'-5' RNA ligase